MNPDDVNWYCKWLSTLLFAGLGEQWEKGAVLIERHGQVFNKDTRVIERRSIRREV